MIKTQKQVQPTVQISNNICRHCLSRSLSLKQINPEVQEVYSSISKLPLYVYPQDENEKPCLIGYVYKCLTCHKDNYFKWLNVPSKYSSQTIRKRFIEANENKYTRGLTEAEIVSPKSFVPTDEEVSILDYSKRFNKLLEDYSKLVRGA